MITRYSAAFKLTALLVVLAVAQVYIFAAPGRSLFGRLVTSSDSVITVNSNEAGSGTTIFSGSQLQTPENATASVQLDSLGKLEMSPETNLTLSFNEHSVDVNVIAGSALLTTHKGITGSITFNGKTEMSDPSKESSTVSAGAAPQGGGKGNGPSFGKIFAIGLPIIVGSILAAVYIPCRRRGRNPSPGTPRGPCRRGF